MVARIPDCFVAWLSAVDGVHVVRYYAAIVSGSKTHVGPVRGVLSRHCRIESREKLLPHTHMIHRRPQSLWLCDIMVPVVILSGRLGALVSNWPALFSKHEIYRQSQEHKVCIDTVHCWRINRHRLSLLLLVVMYIYIYWLFITTRLLDLICFLPYGKYMCWIDVNDVIVITRRHIGGIPKVKKEWVKYGNLKISVFSQSVYIVWYNSTLNSLQAH